MLVSFPQTRFFLPTKRNVELALRASVFALAQQLGVNVSARPKRNDDFCGQLVKLIRKPDERLMLRCMRMSLVALVSTVEEFAMQDSEFDTIQRLIVASTDGDDKAREQLFQQLQDFLGLMAAKHVDKNLVHKVAPSDIMQQTFCNVVKNLDDFRGHTAAEFHGWLKAIMINEVRNARRDLHAAKRDVAREKSIEGGPSGAGNWIVPQDDCPTPSSKALAKEQVDNFYEILKQLPADQAEVIELRSIQQLPFKEVGEKMGRSQNAVSKLWYRAVVNFEDLLKESEAFKSRVQNEEL